MKKQKIYIIILLSAMIVLMGCYRSSIGISSGRKCGGRVTAKKIGEAARIR